MTDELLLTDGQRLLRRILECPDDDATRLIYSDWLEEQGDDWDIDAARDIRWAVAHTKESAVCLCVQSIKVNGRACELCRTHKINMPKKRFGTDSPYVMNRGFVSSVSLTCDAFVGGPCPTCENGSVDSGGSTPWGEPINEPCGHCAGTGRIEGVARELFSRNPIVDVRLTCRNPSPPGYMIGWRRGEWTTNDGLPNEIYDLLDGYFDNHGNSEREWKSYISEADANTALSRACVAYGRSLVGLPALTT